MSSTSETAGPPRHQRGMSNAIILAVAIAALSLSHDARADESRFDVGLLIGSTRATDEGGALTLNRGTTYQANVCI